MLQNILQFLFSFPMVIITIIVLAGIADHFTWKELRRQAREERKNERNTTT